MKKLFFILFGLILVLSCDSTSESKPKAKSLPHIIPQASGAEEEPCHKPFEIKLTSPRHFEQKVNKVLNENEKCFFREYLKYLSKSYNPVIEVRLRNFKNYDDPQYQLFSQHIRKIKPKISKSRIDNIYFFYLLEKAGYPLLEDVMQEFDRKRYHLSQKGKNYGPGTGEVFQMFYFKWVLKKLKDYKFQGLNLKCLFYTDFWFSDLRRYKYEFRKCLIVDKIKLDRNDKVMISFYNKLFKAKPKLKKYQHIDIWIIPPQIQTLKKATDVGKLLYNEDYQNYYLQFDKIVESKKRQNKYDILIKSIKPRLRANNIEYKHHIFQLSEFDQNTLYTFIEKDETRVHKNSRLIIIINLRDIRDNKAEMIKYRVPYNCDSKLHEDHFFKSLVQYHSSSNMIVPMINKEKGLLDRSKAFIGSFFAKPDQYEIISGREDLGGNMFLLSYYKNKEYEIWLSHHGGRVKIDSNINLKELFKKILC